MTIFPHQSTPRQSHKKVSTNSRHCEINCCRIADHTTVADDNRLALLKCEGCAKNFQRAACSLASKFDLLQHYELGA